MAASTSFDTLSAQELAVSLPAEFDRPHQAMQAYVGLPSLTSAYLLDSAVLTAYQYSLVNGQEPRATHLLTGSWCQLELAQARDHEGSSAEAREIIKMAGYYATKAERLVGRDYKEHEEYYDRLFRAKLLMVYAGNFADILPTSWPDRAASAQKTTYRRVQRELVDPVVEAYDFYLHHKLPIKENSNSPLQQLKGILGELVVLQIFNRLAQSRQHAPWAVVPASSRENNRCTSDVEVESRRSSTAFDVKLWFPDQTFIPVEVKWKSSSGYEKVYDSRITKVSANGYGYSAHGVARAMSDEVDGQRLKNEPRRQLRAMTQAVVGSLAFADRQGESLYREGSLEAAAAELALWNLVDEHGGHAAL